MKLGRFEKIDFYITNWYKYSYTDLTAQLEMIKIVVSLNVK